MDLVVSLIMLSLSTLLGTAGAIWLGIWYLRRGNQVAPMAPIAGGANDPTDSLAAVRCRACDTLISARARRCPHCTSSL